MAEEATCTPAWTAAAEALRALLFVWGCDEAALAAAREDLKAAFAAAQPDVVPDGDASALVRALSLVAAVQRVPVRKMRALVPRLAKISRQARVLARDLEAELGELVRACEDIGAHIDEQVVLSEITAYKEFAEWTSDQEWQLRNDVASLRYDGRKNKAFNSFAKLLIVYHHQRTGAWPTITTDPKTTGYGGFFFRFTESFFAAAVQFADRQGWTDHSLWPGTAQARGAAIKRLVREIRKAKR